MLKGEAKKDYQRRYMRDYMRDYRHKKHDVKTPEMATVQPKTYEEALRIGRERMVNGYIPSIQYDADGNPIYEE